MYAVLFSLESFSHSENYTSLSSQSQEDECVRLLECLLRWTLFGLSTAGESSPVSKCTLYNEPNRLCLYSTYITTVTSSVALFQFTC